MRRGCLRKTDIQSVLPAILGWLIARIVFGPDLAEVVTLEITEALWYKVLIKFFECFAGVMIGREIIFKKISKSGKQIIGITFVQSIGTFLVVSAVFAVVLLLAHLPIYPAFIFGGNALATAPAPALSIVNEYHTSGPVTKTLIPLAAIDNIIGVFGFLYGYLCGKRNGRFLFRFAFCHSRYDSAPVCHRHSQRPLRCVCDKPIRESPNAIRMPNRVSLRIGRMRPADGQICVPFLLFELPADRNGVQRNRGQPGIGRKADQHDGLIRSPSESFARSRRGKSQDAAGLPPDRRCGLFTAIYILSRAAGKIGGAYLGGKITKAEPTVTKYLGFTLLPHSGVSLVFTGIPVTTLKAIDASLASIVSGTIVAAAILNEILAVIVAKFAFKWAGEIRE